MEQDKALSIIDAEITELAEVAAANALATAGAIADDFAASAALTDYRARRSAQTLRRQRADLDLFKTYLAAAGIDAQELDLYNDVQAWAGITWGLVAGFTRWQLAEGYAIGSVNVRLATIKVYAQIAVQAGTISETQYALIKTVKGYRHAEGRNADEQREKAQQKTRQDGAKKAAPVAISPAHAALLKKQPYTRRGRRDALLMCLLLDLGLRCGEVADLEVSDFNLSAGKLIFYRHKVDLTQEHDLTPDTFLAARAYLADVPEGQEPLFEGICSKRRIDERSINSRVAALGLRVGITGLSPHDCRHFWADDAIRNGTDIKSLQDAGGWASPAMPLRYAASAKVANSGVKLTATRKGGNE